MLDQREINSHRNNSAAFVQGLGSPSRDTHNNIFQLFGDTETPSRWEKLRLTMVCCPQACRPQTSWNLKVDVADSYLPHHQPIRRMSMSWSCPLGTITIKLLSILSKLGYIVFRGRSPRVSPPLPGKVIKLSFSTTPRTLSPRFDSAPVYRETELLASLLLKILLIQT